MTDSEPSISLLKKLGILIDVIGFGPDQVGEIYRYTKKGKRKPLGSIVPSRDNQYYEAWLNVTRLFPPEVEPCHTTLIAITSKMEEMPDAIESALQEIQPAFEAFDNGTHKAEDTILKHWNAQIHKTQAESLLAVISQQKYLNAKTFCWLDSITRKNLEVSQEAKIKAELSLAKGDS